MPTLDEIKLNAAIELIKEMGAVIRYLDENAAYCSLWLNDGNEKGSEYVPKAVDLGIME